MSAELQEKLLKLIPFRGIPSYDKRIADVEELIENVEDAVILDALEVLDEVEETLENVPQVLKGIAVKTIYLNSVTGSDENTGETADSALKTLDHYLTVANPDAPNFCIVNGGDYEINESHRVNLKKLIIEFSGSNDATVTFKDGSLFGTNGANITFVGLNVVFDRSKLGLPMTFNRAFSHIGFFRCNLSATPQDLENGGDNIVSGDRVNVVWIASIIGVNLQGRISTAAAGGNSVPRSGLSSNLAQF